MPKKIKLTYNGTAIESTDYITTPDDLENFATEDYVDSGLASKQNTLTAGTNITIDENNVISAAGGTEIPVLVFSIEQAISSDPIQIQLTSDQFNILKSAKLVTLDFSEFEIGIATGAVAEDTHSIALSGSFFVPMGNDTGAKRLSIFSFYVPQDTKIMHCYNQDIPDLELTIATEKFVEDYVEEHGKGFEIPSVQLIESQIISQDPLTIQLTDLQFSTFKSNGIVKIVAPELGIPGSTIFFYEDPYERYIGGVQIESETYEDQLNGMRILCYGVYEDTKQLFISPSFSYTGIGHDIASEDFVEQYLYQEMPSYVESHADKKTPVVTLTEDQVISSTGQSRSYQLTDEQYGVFADEGTNKIDLYQYALNHIVFSTQSNANDICGFAAEPYSSFSDPTDVEGVDFHYFYIDHGTKRLYYKVQYCSDIDSSIQYNAYQLNNQKTLEISETSTDAEYPSAKAVYDYVQEQSLTDAEVQIIWDEVFGE